MGNFSGFISSAIFIGLLAVLVYFCCRAKRKGAVLNQTGGVTVTVQQAPQPHSVSGGLIGYPHPMSQPSYPPQNSVYAPTTTGGGGNPYGNPYNPYSQSNATNLPYPPSGASRMPMPNTGVTNNNLQRSNAPYPTGAHPSAPFQDEDLPPSYETVVRQTY